MYETELRSILDKLMPQRSAKIRLRPSDPWFDEDCREAKRQTRRLERTALRTSKDDDISRWRQQRTAYRNLTHRKRVNFWRDRIERERGSGRELWSSINEVLSRGRVVTNSSLNAEQLLHLFTTKLNNVGASTAACGTLPSPTPYSGTPLVGFSPVGLNEVLCLINSLPNNQCSLDPIPTWLLKKTAPNLAPFLVKLFNKSLSDGVFPQTFKTSYITPILKKPNLDCGDTTSFRPKSNLSVISKLLERLILVKFTKHLDNNILLPINQSAYRQYQSTETAVLKVFSDVLEAADQGKLTLLNQSMDFAIFLS